MTIAIERKSELIKDFNRQEGDTGSPEVQIALLTERIKVLQKHFKTHKKDHSSRRGLILMVGQRNRLLRYLSRTNQSNYQEVIKKLGLRK